MIKAEVHADPIRTRLHATSGFRREPQRDFTTKPTALLATVITYLIKREDWLDQEKGKTSVLELLHLPTFLQRFVYLLLLLCDSVLGAHGLCC